MRPSINRLFSLRGAKGIVTGGSEGLGLAIATALAEAGARVHAFSRTGRPKRGGSRKNVTHHVVDVTDTARLAKAVDDIGRRYGLDFVVHCAGITVRAPFTKGTSAEWRHIQEVNVVAGAELARCAHRYLKKSRHPGRVLFISSMAAHLGFSEVVPYGASKAAVIGLMRGLAVEWARDGILVNSVAPGWFPTALTAQVMDASRKAKILRRMPLHRFGRPEELAAAAVFLLSPASSYITGHDLAVDGGALAFGY